MAFSCRRILVLLAVAALAAACGSDVTPSTETVGASAPADVTETPEPTPTAEPTTIPEPSAAATPAAPADPTPSEPPATTEPPPPQDADVPPLVALCARGLGEVETVELDPAEVDATSPEEALEQHRPNEVYLQGVDLEPAARSETRATWDIILPDGTIGGHLYFEAFDGRWAYVGGDFCA